MASPPREFSLNDWLALPGWTPDGTLIKHQGGDFVLAPLDFARGTVEFTALALKGKSIGWVVAYRDPRNYTLFELDDKNLIRTQVENGRRLPPVAAQYGQAPAPTPDRPRPRPPVIPGSVVVVILER